MNNIFCVLSGLEFPSAIIDFFSDTVTQFSYGTLFGMIPLEVLGWIGGIFVVGIVVGLIKLIIDII